MTRVVIAVLSMAAIAACASPTKSSAEYRPRSDTSQGTSGAAGNTGASGQQQTTLPPVVVTTPPVDPESERTVIEDPEAPPPPAGRSFGGGIGSNCGGGVACLGAATECLSDSYPSGMCSTPCSRFCPDTTTSKTFCINDHSGDGGICAAKCTTNADCRAGYTCETKTRFNESGLSKKVCVPATEPIRSCVEELVALIPNGAEIAPIHDGYTTCNSQVPGCDLTDGVRIPTSFRGVSFISTAGPTLTMDVSCKMAQALVRFADFARANGVTHVAYSKAYSCEGSATGASVSPHGLGLALDITSLTRRDATGAVKTYNAEDYTTALVISDFWMVDFLKALQKNHVFSNIYTKECRASSDPADLFADHFHVDMSQVDAPIRDWYTSGGHWYLDEEELRLVSGPSGKVDTVFPVSPAACTVTAAQLCEAP